jgi:formate-dependent nitrite reductase membrane component NrfD
VFELAETVRWGFPTLVHYFLAGMGGGAMAIGSLLLMLSRRRTSFFNVARYAAFIAPIVVFDDAIVLILELGRPSRFMNIFTHVNFESPLWLGSWLMVIFLVVSVPYAFTFLALPNKEGSLRRILRKLGVPADVGPRDKWMRLRWGLAFVGLPLGIAVCHYPGFMMSGLVARPLWSTALFPTVTLLSGLATAMAAIVLCRALFVGISRAVPTREYREDSYLLISTNLVLLIAEAAVLAQLIVYARNASGDLQLVIDEVIGDGGLLTNEFWWGAVGMGFVVPIITGLALVMPRLIFSRSYDSSLSVEAVMPTSILTGSLILIYVLLFGGQLTHPIGL